MVEFRNVSKTYDNGTVALKNVSLNVQKGEFVYCRRVRRRKKHIS